MPTAPFFHFHRKEHRRRKLSPLGRSTFFVLLLLICAEKAAAKSEDGKAAKIEEGEKWEGEFVAGSFILTQKSLNEAPYRYAGVLRKALDRVETKDPPSQSDVKNCDVRYKISPSGRRSVLRINDETLTVTLKENNTVVVGAKVYVEVAAKTWIWKGINFGLLGCLKMNSCNGQIVTYSANVDFQIAFQVFWVEEEQRLRVRIKPVNTVLQDVSVRGCKPPWYLFWFKKWQSLLNRGVQEAFQEYANNYEHQSEVPEIFSPFKDVFVKHKITDLIWNPEYVVFKANASFSALVGGVNKTFVPEESTPLESFPVKHWNLTSPLDGHSHLLQGVRVSTEFLNSLMWYASVTNVTKYHGDTRVLDSHINGTISYTPPVIRVKRDNLLSIDIGHGLLLATCVPTTLGNSSDMDEMRRRCGKRCIVGKDGKREPATLFKAEFSQLSGSGRIRLASTRDETGIMVSLDDMDLSRMVTKPFEPKLPLPESFETELMRNAIAQLQPVINQYLKEKPLILPDNVAPFAASPELYLWNTGNGTGYAEVMSYCSCSGDKKSTKFAQCDPRSHICDGKGRPEFEVATPDPDDGGSLFDIKDVVKDGVAGILGIAKGVLNRRRNKTAVATSRIDDGTDGTFNDAGVEETHLPLDVNFTQIVRNKNFSYTGVHFSLFEDSEKCDLSMPGDNAKVYWLWRTGQCTPLYLHGINTNQYYFLDMDHMHFGCDDKLCKRCQFKADLPGSDLRCQRTNTGESFHLGSLDIEQWQQGKHEGEEEADMSLIGNVFFNDEFCSFLPNYVEPQLLSSHTHLGRLNSQKCTIGDHSGDSVSNHYDRNDTHVLSATWSCEEKCFGCLFRLKNVATGECHPYETEVQIVFTETIPVKIEVVIMEAIQNHPEIVYVSAAVLVSLVLLVGVAIVACKKYQKNKVLSSPIVVEQHPPVAKPGLLKRIKQSMTHNLRQFGTVHLGFRILTWKRNQMKDIREDLIQNGFLIINGALAIVFALEWNSDNNPLLIIHNKFHDGLTVDADLFKTERVAQFAAKLNFLTYLVNVVNATFAFFIVTAWTFSKTGSRSMWMRLRLASCVSLLAGIFIVIAFAIFSTYFDTLVVLETDQGFFITDNPSMHRVASKVLKVSLNGLSLTVISFTIVFLFHGVGGGLYCGTVLFRLLHVNSRQNNMEILTTLLVILTFIQPFICLHPVIIWSQDSRNNSTFLVLVIIIWSLPLIVHIMAKAAITQGRLKCASFLHCSKNDRNALDTKEEQEMVGLNGKNDLPSPTARTSSVSLTIFDYGVQAFQLVIFLATFSIITHFIVKSEFNSERKNLQDFVLPAIVSVFFWMASISYLLLALVMDDSARPEKRLVFKDQNLEAARSMLQSSLRRRLNTSKARTLHANNRRSFHEEESISLSDSMNAGQRKRSTLPANIDLNGSVGSTGQPRRVNVRGPRRPFRPPPPPPIRAKGALPPVRGPPVRGAGPSVPPPKPPKPSPGVVLERMDRLEESRAREKYLVRGTRGNGPRKSVETKVRQKAPDYLPEIVISTDNKKNVEDGDLSLASEALSLSEAEGACAKFKALYHFLKETTEYRDPTTYGWRIKFRRIFLTCGVILFTFLTIYTTVSTQDFESKDEIQTMLDYAGTNLTWPDSGSVLDDVFQLYNRMERAKSYIMIGASLLFWASLVLDFASHFTTVDSRRELFFTGSRVTNFFGSLTVFASVIVVGLPDYLEASHLDDISPFCGVDFNRTVRQVAEFTIGLFFACLFTFQLLPILVTIGPALVRASVLILIHPSLQLQVDDRVTTLRMTILQQVIGFSGLLTFPITFISMSIVQQYQKDLVVTCMILMYWSLPPLVLFLGLYYTRKYRRYTILLYVYYLYNFCYVMSLTLLLLYSLTFETLIETLGDMMQKPTFWASSMAQVFLCNVVISDMLYMTVF